MTSSTSAILNIQSIRVVPLLYTLAAIWILHKLSRFVYVLWRRRSHSTPLYGPPRTSLFWGASRMLMTASDQISVFEEWLSKYGTVFKIPAPMGAEVVVLCDPKAIAHFYARETYGYHQTSFVKLAIESLIGRGLLWAEGDDHKRQRRAISPAFSNTSIKNATVVFYDSAYKVKDIWDSMFHGALDDTIVTDVQIWMNYISLDSIGIAGFSHNFGCLEGKPSPVAQIFEAFGNLKPTFTMLAIIVVAQVFPIVWRLPTKRRQLNKELNRNVEVIAEKLLSETRKEQMGESGREDKSLIGLLIKAESDDTELHMSQEEVMAQMKVLILAGYETTSISLTWALIELSRKPEAQEKLRAELSQFSGSDPTWEQLTNSLPYLDAVVHEVLRLHPPLEQTTRIAVEDDVIPLSEPLRTPSGTVDRLHISKDQLVSVRIDCMNNSTSVWGPDAREFRPERWLDIDGLPSKAKEIQGHKHLLTFVDGARICLGRNFALAEFKSVLSVLIRNYSFDFPNGKCPEIGLARGILSRPKFEGEEGPRTPLKIRRLE